VLYKTTRGYYPDGERCIVWDDATLGIAWPLAELEGIAPEVSGKDARGARFEDADLP